MIFELGGGREGKPKNNRLVDGMVEHYRVLRRTGKVRSQTPTVVKETYGRKKKKPTSGYVHRFLYSIIFYNIL